MCMDIVVYSPSLLSMVMPYSAPNWYCKRLCTLLTPISRKNLPSCRHWNSISERLFRSHADTVIGDINTDIFGVVRCLIADMYQDVSGTALRFDPVKMAFSTKGCKVNLIISLLYRLSSSTCISMEIVPP